MPRFRTEVRSGGGPIYGHDFVCGRAHRRASSASTPCSRAAVLECVRKPPAPPGAGGLDAFGHVPDVDLPDEDAWYALVALGRRDCEPRRSAARCSRAPTSPAPRATSACSSRREPLAPATSCAFAVDYDALVRAVTSPFVALECTHGGRPAAAAGSDTRGGSVTHAETRRVGPRRPLQIVSPDEVRRIHETSLDILAEIGCVFHSKRALDVLAEARRRASTTRRPSPASRPRSSRRALATLPHSFTLGGRTPAFDLPHRRRARLHHLRRLRHLRARADGTVRPSDKADV